MDFPMIIDLTVDARICLPSGEYKVVYVYSGSTMERCFLAEDGTAAYTSTTPVLSVMTDFLRHFASALFLNSWD